MANYSEYIKFHSRVEQNILDLAKERHELYSIYSKSVLRIGEINKIIANYYDTTSQDINYYAIETLKTAIDKKYAAKNNLDTIIRITAAAIKKYKLKKYTAANYSLYIQRVVGMISQERFDKIMMRRFISHGTATEALNKLISFTNTLCLLTNKNAEEIEKFIESQDIIRCEIIELSDEAVYLKF